MRDFNPNEEALGAAEHALEALQLAFQPYTPYAAARKPLEAARERLHAALVRFEDAGAEVSEGELYIYLFDGLAWLTDALRRDTFNHAHLQRAQHALECVRTAAVPY